MSDVDLHARLYAAEQALNRVTRPVAPAEAAALEAAQARADSVAAMFGDRAPPPTPGERPLAYRRRLLKSVAPHSPRFAASRFDGLDAPTLAAVEDQVYADAASVARGTAARTPGRLTAFTERDRAGREITTFAGDIGGFLAPFVGAGQTVKLIR